MAEFIAGAILAWTVIIYPIMILCALEDIKHELKELKKLKKWGG